MNSLYGRFGINPKSTSTEICDEDRYKQLIRYCDLIYADMLKEKTYIVAYHTNTDKNDNYWNPPKNSAVQLSAAITACARMYMYPFISKEDCYYTDTDSVVLSKPLPDEVIDAKELGKFKLECRIQKGYFLAPKTYHYITYEGQKELKYKGQGKGKVIPQWFEETYADPSHTEQVQVDSFFRIDWHTLNIMKKETNIQLKINIDTKRKAVYKESQWVDTEPIDISDFSSLDYASKQIINRLWNDISKLENENTMLKKKLIMIDQRYKEQAGDKKKRILTQKPKKEKISSVNERKNEQVKPKKEKKKPP